MTSVTRHQTFQLTRCNQNAWTEVDAVNRCARFPAFRASACSRLRALRFGAQAARRLLSERTARSLGSWKLDVGS